MANNPAVVWPLTDAKQHLVEMLPDIPDMPEREWFATLTPDQQAIHSMLRQYEALEEAYNATAHPSQAAGGAEEAARSIMSLVFTPYCQIGDSFPLPDVVAIIQKAIDAALQAKPDMTFTDDDILDAHTQGMQDGRGMKAKPDSGCLPVAQVVIIERQTAIAAMRAIMDAFYDADLNRAEKVYRAYLAKAPAAPAHKEGE